MDWDDRERKTGRTFSQEQRDRIENESATTELVRRLATALEKQLVALIAADMTAYREASKDVEKLTVMVKTWIEHEYPNS